MQRTPPFPFLPNLETPMRDAMRGVASFAEATEDALEPASQLLPGPLRVGFLKAIKSIETTGRQFIARPLGQDEIRAARDYANGMMQGPAAAKEFAEVVCFAWEHLQHVTNGTRLMISETILASKIAQHNALGSETVHAAELVDVVRKSSAIGRMPGIADGIGAEERKQIDLALAAIMIWLLATPADSLEEERTLLELAMALATAIKNDIDAAMDDQVMMADILDAASAHL